MNQDNQNIQSSMHEHTMLKKIMKWIIPASIFLMPVFFVPAATVGVYSAKATLFGLLTFFALIVYLANLLSSGELAIPKVKFLIPLILIPILALVSAALSGSFTKSFSGSVVEVNTALFWIIGVIFALVAALSVRDIRTAFRSTNTLILSVALILLVLVVKIFAVNGMFPLSLVSLIPDSLAITIIDAGVLAGAAIILSFSMLSFGIRSMVRKVFLWIIIALSLVLLASINFAPVVVLLAIFAVIHFVYNVTLGRKGQNDPTVVGMAPARKVPVPSLVVIVACTVLIFGGNTVSQSLSNSLKISSFDVRPGAQVTMSLVGEAWKQNAIFGIGPNKFSNIWNFSKPSTINTTDFWSVDFSSGFSFLLTAAAEMGLLGSLAILAFLVLFIYAGFKAMFVTYDDPSKRYAVTLVFSTALYLWLTALVYSPSISVLSLAFITTGVFAALLSTSGAAGRKVLNIFASSRSNFFGVFVVVVLIIASITGGFVVFEKSLAASLFNKAYVVSSSDQDQAIQYISRAVNIAPSDVYFRALSSLYANKVQAIIQSVPANSTAISDDVRKNLQDNVGLSVQAARSAIALDSKYYLNSFTLGSVYEVLAKGGVAGAVDSAKQAYADAEKAAPSNPAVSLGLARADIIAGDLDTAIKDVDQSIALKPNYSDAYFLKAQIEAAKNDIPSAIKSVENATIVDPTNAGLFFQLGLLKYNVGDYIGAATALEKALTLVPNYANAQYFLGLSYELLGRRADAITQFEALAKTNPDNQEILFILNNLKAGKSPFTNVKPPLDSKPEKRTEPPVSQSE